jgi:hypothetical protein
MKKFFDELNEATFLGSGQISGDDDLPTGTTVFGDKMVPVEVENRLTGKTIKYVPAADLEQEWNYDEFDHSMSMGSIKAYSKTLDDLDGMLGGRLFSHTDRRKFRLQGDKWLARSTAKDGGVVQKAKLSDDDEDTMDITEKINQFLGDNPEPINEAVIDKDDRKGLTNAILKGKPVKLKFDSLDGVSASVTGKGDKVLVTYAKNEDLTLTLVDICDSLGYDFEVKKQGALQHFYITK